MKEYKKMKKIERLSCPVEFLTQFPSGRIEILLFLIILIIIILCSINFLIIPWKIINDSLFILRIVYLSFLILSLGLLIYNIILRKNKALNLTNYCISLYSSIISLAFILIDFFFIFVSLIIVYIKIKKYKNRKYYHNSILTIDIFSLLNLMAAFFLWYLEILNIYAKTKYEESLKEHIDEKIRFYESQRANIINYESEAKSNKDFNINDINTKNIGDDDSITNNNNNNIEISGDKPIENRTININNFTKENDVTKDSK